MQTDDDADHFFITKWHQNTAANRRLVYRQAIFLKMAACR